jgi:Glycosyl transferase family 2
MPSIQKHDDLTRLLQDKPVLKELLEAYWPSLEKVAVDSGPDVPFLSVVIRTRGTRAATLHDALMSLVSQTSQDFEVILVVHSSDAAAHASVRETVGELPESLRGRISLISCGRAGRASPLNDGFAQARGRYVAALDDDDVALEHWVETFEKLASEGPPGALLRAACVRQDFAAPASGSVSAGPRSLPGFTPEYPRSFSLLSHLKSNNTPAMCVAYPIAVFRQDGLRFDERLSTVEDWDFLMRAVMLRGITTTPEVTAIYRWGAATDSSAATHASSEWVANEAAVRERLNRAPVLLPAGAASELQRLREFYLDFATELLTSGRAIPEIFDDPELAGAVQAALFGHLNSRSWRLTRPFRRTLKWVTRRRPEPDWAFDSMPPSVRERLLMLRQIQQSRSWKVTYLLRVAAKMARRLSAVLHRSGTDCAP